MRVLYDEEIMEIRRQVDMLDRRAMVLEAMMNLLLRNYKWKGQDNGRHADIHAD